MAFVLDASVTLCWAFEDENDSAAEVAYGLLQTDSAVVPGVWWFEVRNSLLMSERRGRSTEEDTRVFLRLLGRLPVLIDRLGGEAEVMGLARKHGLTVYDAAYLELAVRRKSPLASLDKKLLGAGRAGGW